MKLKLESKDQFLGRMAIKHKISLSGYPLSYYKKGNCLHVIACGIMFGKDKNKEELIKDAKIQPELINIEQNKDFIILTTKQPLFAEPTYNPKIIRVSPVIINHKEKMHTWELASFEKELLTRVYTFAKKHYNAQMLYLKQTKLSNISITNILPELTSKQMRALEIAVNNGYYNYPKNIKMEKLAEIMGISYSTYQAHLKKTEHRIIPSVYSKL